MIAGSGGKVTVAKDEANKPMTVSKDSTRSDWRMQGEGSEIIGIPQEKIVSHAQDSMNEDGQRPYF